MSARVRRHLSVLAALLLLITMWSYRLESYDLMIRGGGEQGVFSYVDHRWLLPGLLLLWIATAAVAITVLLSGWTGQLPYQLRCGNCDRGAVDFGSGDRTVGRSPRYPEGSANGERAAIHFDSG